MNCVTSQRLRLTRSIRFIKRNVGNTMPLSKHSFLRAHAYSAPNVAGILDEATRQPHACKHIERPSPPRWLVGDRARVDGAVTAHMSTSSAVKRKNGDVFYRKRHPQHRCLVAGVASHPIELAWLRALRQSNAAAAMAKFLEYKKWRTETIAWLVQQFGTNLVGVVEHSDESHLHIHYFVVGDAQRLHPGLRAELVDDCRIAARKARCEAYSSGMAAWLDLYHEQVGERNGMIRGDGSSRPIWRIKDRSVRTEIANLQAAIQAVLDEQERAYLDDLLKELYDSQPQHKRRKMKF